MRVVVDYTKCVGHGMCESFSPELFEVTDQGEVKILEDPVPDGMEADVETAVASCPVQALSSTD